MTPGELMDPDVMMAGDDDEPFYGGFAGVDPTVVSPPVTSEVKPVPPKKVVSKPIVLPASNLTPGSYKLIIPGQQNQILLKQQPQQIVLLAPKQKAGLKPLAPAPSTTQSIRVISKDGKTTTAGGQPVQIIRLVTSSASSTSKTTSGLRTIAPSPSNRVMVCKGSTSSTNPQVIMIPANLLGNQTVIKASPSTSSGLKIQLTDKKPSFVPIAPSPSTSVHMHPSNKEVLAGLKTVERHRQDNGVQKRESSDMDPSNKKRPCNCSKSQCLKLYCDCFANGEFCSNCNCINCSNNLDHEDERQKAIRQCLERNPHAFHPKIGKGRMTGDVTERRHTKGCNCRRSGCLKNYCEVSLLLINLINSVLVFRSQDQLL